MVHCEDVTRTYFNENVWPLKFWLCFAVQVEGGEEEMRGEGREERGEGRGEGTDERREGRGTRTQGARE